MNGIEEFMKMHGDTIPKRVDYTETHATPTSDFMLGYEYLLVRQGDDNFKAKFQPCENIDEVNYFINMCDGDFGYHGSYAVYKMIHFSEHT